MNISMSDASVFVGLAVAGSVLQDIVVGGAYVSTALVAPVTGAFMYV